MRIREGLVADTSHGKSELNGVGLKRTFVSSARAKQRCEAPPRIAVPTPGRAICWFQCLARLSHVCCNHKSLPLADRIAVPRHDDARLGTWSGNVRFGPGADGLQPVPICTRS